ncbi:hypothetical protein J2W56_004982 [Nocardia kruczakiae]|uniref:DUF3558 domain-containing protein n=1 Tax=Nocardia kruczakiae TaxID=261477 RepID=A0ABU1XKZ8_9NOCA|nr:DUF3558 domain-containing protein [Nocardia kruczakiae]MDR7171223.1 hypothetical protein [Nocardia kruczakiae]
MTAIRSSIFAAAMAVVAVASLGGCTDDGSAASSESTTQPTSSSIASRPTLTNSKLQPPSQHDVQMTTGRPAVVFDPCTWISDDTVRKSGFDPGTRKRGHDQIAEISFLTCSFDSDSGSSINYNSLSVNSGNATWDEDLTKVRRYSEPVTINGREAMWVRDPQVQSMCQIDLRTKVGFAQVAVSSNDPQAARPCDNLLSIASNIESEIGKDN